MPVLDHERCQRRGGGVGIRHCWQNAVRGPPLVGGDSAQRVSAVVAEEVVVRVAVPVVAFGREPTVISSVSDASLPSVMLSVSDGPPSLRATDLEEAGHRTTYIGHTTECRHSV